MNQDLMVLNRSKTEQIEHKIFKDIIDYLKPGDCLVRNNTKVIPARLYGKKKQELILNFFLLNKYRRRYMGSIVRPGNKLHVWYKVIFGDGIAKSRSTRYIMARWNKKSRI
jgi:S-adenosylmethionine:tRNA ribosyltransferase-isomerase